MIEGICDVCGNEAELKSSVESIKHSHLTASDAQSIVMATVFFQYVDSNNVPWLCEPCQKDVISGMDKGGNFD